MRYLEFDHTIEIAPPQNAIVGDFLNALIERDIDAFVRCLSKEDKSYLRGCLDTLNKLEEEENDIRDWYAEALSAARQSLSAYLEDYGVSSLVRYNELSRVYVYLHRDVKVTIVNIAEREATVMPLPLVLELTQSNEGELLGQWKIGMFSDSKFKAPI